MVVYCYCSLSFVVVCVMYVIYYSSLLVFGLLLVFFKQKTAYEI